MEASSAGFHHGAVAFTHPKLEISHHGVSFWIPASLVYQYLKKVSLTRYHSLTAGPNSASRLEQFESPVKSIRA